VQKVRRHTYAQAEKFILSREFFGMKLGLENITRFLEDLGNPQHRYLTVHLAGTNGKGSSAAMLASIFHHAGCRTGLFTSPHLVDFRERITVDGTLIPRPALTRFIDRHRSVLVKKNSPFSN
jgi:dihydrofolate synthase / folylpolyglutamate synthase